MAILQVWWYVAGAVGGNLYMHDLAHNSVHELEEARKEPPISIMHHDAEGHVWLGHRGGVVRVWSDSGLTPVTVPMKCFHADIRYVKASSEGPGPMLCIQQPSTFFAALQRPMEAGD